MSQHDVDAPKAATARRERETGARLVQSGLDALDFGFAVFDRTLRLVASNRAFRTLRGYPAALCRPGTELVELYRFNASTYDLPRARSSRGIAYISAKRSLHRTSRIASSVKTSAPGMLVERDKEFGLGLSE